MHKTGLLALSPLFVFVAFYLSASIIAGDFYKVPLSIAFLMASVYAVMITRGALHKRINVYSRGAGSPQIMLMIWIFVLAGAFANSAKMMGSVDATVALTLSLLPAKMLLAGLFLSACFISLSIGTSVGTIVALTPLAAGIAASTGCSVALLTAVVVGGSFFGDNLSFISDTTIVATQTQGCRMSDKFRVNAFIVVPAAIVILLLYIVLGQDITTVTPPSDYSLLKVLPYLAVLVTAIFGVNVLIVLTVGIILTGIIGIADTSYTFFEWLQALGDGVMSMGELIIITMMAGGLLAMIRHGHGLDYVITHLTRRISSKRWAELSIAALVSAVNVCTANNTVAIITVGSIAHKIGERYQLDPRKCASLLDTFSCFVQGLLPYGAQLLMASGLALISPLEIIPHLYYTMAIGLAALIAILLRYPRRYS